MDTSDWITLGAAILTGGGTLFLGTMAWRTIRQTRNLQKAEKRERLLNEIIEWVRNILTWRSRHKDIFRDVARSTSDIESIRLTHANIAQVLGDFTGITDLNEYMKEIALRLEQGLPETVEELINDTGTYIDFLEQRFYKLTPNIKRGVFSETDEVINTTEILAEQMISSARYVLASIAKIKTKDIGKKEENMSKEGEPTENSEPTLKDIDDHLHQLGTQIKKGSYFTGAALGAAIALVGISFQVQMSFKLSPYVYIWFFIVVGLGFMFWCKWKQSKIK